MGESLLLAHFLCFPTIHGFGHEGYSHQRIYRCNALIYKQRQPDMASATPPENVAFVRHAEAILIYKKIKRFFACIPTFFRLKN